MLSLFVKKLFSIIFFVILFFNTVVAEINRTEASNLVLNAILKQENTKKDIYFYNKVFPNSMDSRLLNTEIRSPFKKSWLFFVDDIPFADWLHPCRYIFVDVQTGKYKVIKNDTPPYGFDRYNPDSPFEILSSAPRPPKRPMPSGNIGKITALNKSASVNPNLYAVLVSGAESGKYWNNLSAMFCTLTQKYGYAKENIFVHWGDGVASQGSDLDGPQTPSNDIDYNAFHSTLEKTFKNLSGEWTNAPEIPALGPDDQLFIFFTGHGGYDGINDKSNLVIEDSNNLWDYELAGWLENLNCGAIIYMGTQCHSGGFINDLSDYTNFNPLCKSRTFHAACAEDEFSYAEYIITTEAYDEFVYYWTAAVRGAYPLDNPWIEGRATGQFPFNEYDFGACARHGSDYNPDSNSDGKIQLSEAFSYANNLDTHSQDGYYCQDDDPVPNSTTTIGGGTETPVDKNSQLLDLRGISGDIINNQTILGNYFVNGDLSVSGNSTLNIISGTVLSFRDNTSFTINGTLSVQGTASNPITFIRSGGSGLWAGLKINGTANIDHAIIEYAGQGVSFLNPSTGSILNSELHNNNYGIYVNGSLPTIQTCNIHDNNGWGIYIYNTNNIGAAGERTRVLNNLIYGNGSYGIDLYNASPSIQNNEIYNQTYGIYGYSNCSPYLGQYEEYGNNNIHDNTYGIGAMNNSNPFLGEENCVVHGGHNQFTANTNHIAASYNCYIQAEQNWWGSNPPQSSKFYITNGSTIDYTPWLVSPPSIANMVVGPNE